VREAIYRSELAAEKTKMRIAALRIAGRAGMPLIMIATTNGEAAAVVPPFLLPAASSGELYGTSIPRRKTRTT